MLSIGKLGVGQQAYYLAAVGRGVEDYYVGPGEAPGVWMGKGAQILGLDGVVSADALSLLLEGIDPATGVPLGRNDRRIPGFDLTFSAPKSVSLLAALGDDTTRAAALAAHRDAVIAALGHLEREACHVRRGHDGLVRLEADGFVAAGFEHRTSRAGDPQLHTHVLIANAARGRDGEWSALDGRALYRHARTAGFLYQTHLRDHLARSLGVEWGPVRNGMAELDGVPAPVLRAFSQRRIDIEAAMAEHSTASSLGAQAATLATRRTKDVNVHPSSLLDMWRGRALSLGFFGHQMRALCRPQRPYEPVPPDHIQVAAEVTHHHATFNRSDVLRAIATLAQQGVSVENVETQATAFLASRQAVRLAKSLAVRYSTPDMLRLEHEILDSVARRRNDHLATAPADALEMSLAARPHLDRRQAALVRQICRSGVGVEAVIGPPGSGKTSALDAARAAWEASGHTVLGAALSARAAAELEAGSGIRSSTIAAFTRELARPETVGLPPNTVLVIDEAAMVGTRDIHTLARLAEHAAAKLVLVGDPHQLPAIEAGGAFTGIVTRHGAFHLTGNHRQRDPRERAALAALRQGKPANALAILHASDSIVEISDAGSTRTTMVADWLTSHLAGERAVMLAIRRHDVELLNAIARHQLVDQGAITGPEISADTGRCFAVGDLVLTSRNHHHLGVHNGDRGHITNIDIDSRTITVNLDRGPTVLLPANYIDNGHLDHAYATTIHKAQGATYDRAFLLGNDQLFREAGYTGLSRGQTENRLYIVGHDPADHDAPRAFTANEPTDLLLAALRRSEAKTMATDHHPDHQAGHAWSR